MVDSAPAVTKIAVPKQRLSARNISRSHRQNRMMRKRKNVTVYLAVAVSLTCYLAQMIDCYRLRKTDRRKDADAAKMIGVQEGKIVFGKVFEKGFSLESQVIDENKSSNVPVEDGTAYQADFTGRKLNSLTA